MAEEMASAWVEAPPHFSNAELPPPWERTPLLRSYVAEVEATRGSALRRLRGGALGFAGASRVAPLTGGTVGAACGLKAVDLRLSTQAFDPEGAWTPLARATFAEGALTGARLHAAAAVCVGAAVGMLAQAGGRGRFFVLTLAMPLYALVLSNLGSLAGDLLVRAYAVPAEAWAPARLACGVAAAAGTLTLSTTYGAAREATHGEGPVDQTGHAAVLSPPTGRVGLRRAAAAASATAVFGLFGTGVGAYVGFLVGVPLSLAWDGDAPGSSVVAQAIVLGALRGGVVLGSFVGAGVGAAAFGGAAPELAREVDIFPGAAVGVSSLMMLGGMGGLCAATFGLWVGGCTQETTARAVRLAGARWAFWARSRCCCGRLRQRPVAGSPGGFSALRKTRRPEPHRPLSLSRE